MAAKPPRIPWSQKIIVLGWWVILVPAAFALGVLAVVSLYLLLLDPRENQFAIVTGAIGGIGCWIFSTIIRSEASYRRLQETYAAEQQENDDFDDDDDFEDGGEFDDDFDDDDDDEVDDRR